MILKVRWCYINYWQTAFLRMKEYTTGSDKLIAWGIVACLRYVINILNILCDKCLEIEKWMLGLFDACLCSISLWIKVTNYKEKWSYEEDCCFQRYGIAQVIAPDWLNLLWTLRICSEKKLHVIWHRTAAYAAPVAFIAHLCHFTAQCGLRGDRETWHLQNFHMNPLHYAYET